MVKIPSDRSNSYDLSVESWKRWCNINDVELLILDELVQPKELMKPNLQKLYAFQLLGPIENEKVCIVDADTLIHPECQNFFNLSSGMLGAVHNDGDYDWIIRSIENYQHEFEIFPKKKFDIWRYINTGFMIVSKRHQELFETILEFYWANDNKIRAVQNKYGVGTDQPLINLFIDLMGVDVQLFPYRFNMQDLNRKNALQNFLFLKIPGIYHFNAIPGGPTSTDNIMSQTFKKLYKE